LLTEGAILTKDEQAENIDSQKLYDAVNIELQNTINLIGLVNVDYTTLIATLIVLFGFIGISIIDQELVYFIPFSLIFILIVSFIYGFIISRYSQVDYNAKDWTV